MSGDASFGNKEEKTGQAVEDVARASVRMLDKALLGLLEALADGSLADGSLEEEEVRANLLKAVETRMGVLREAGRKARKIAKGAGAGTIIDYMAAHGGMGDWNSTESAIAARLLRKRDWRRIGAQLSAAFTKWWTEHEELLHAELGEPPEKRVQAIWHVEAAGLAARLAGRLLRNANVPHVDAARDAARSLRAAARRFREASEEIADGVPVEWIDEALEAAPGASLVSAEGE